MAELIGDINEKYFHFYVTNRSVVRLNTKIKQLGTFEETYQRNYKKMFRVAKKMVGSSDVASDIVQDVFVSFYDKINDQCTIPYPDSWLYRATTNKCVDVLRRNKKFKSLDCVGENKVDEVVDDKVEKIAALNRALSALKIEERALVVLYSEGLSYKEMSEALGIRLTSVGKTLSRCLGKLEEYLKKQEHELFKQ